jgi:hypothetical protein
MKKIILSILGLLLFSSSAFSQFDVGARVGMTSSATNLQDVKFGTTTFSQYRSSYQTGYSMALYARENIKQLYLQLELQYLSSNTDANLNPVSVDGARQIITNVHSFEIPLLVGYKILHTEQFSFNVFGGPAVDYVISSDTKLDGFNDLAVLTDQTKEKLKNNQYLLVAGAEIDIWRLSFDCRYEYGLGNISYQVTNTTQSVVLDRKDTSLNFAVGFKF